MAKCKDCGKEGTVAKGRCHKCYCKYYARTVKVARINNKIGDEIITINLDKEIMTAKEATKYVKYKKQEILEDAIKNPKKYLEGA